MLVKLHHSELPEYLLNLYGKSAISVFLHGTFGIGKSESVRQFAKMMAKQLGLQFSEDPRDIDDESKFFLRIIPLHQMDGAALTGLPFPNEERTKTMFLQLGLFPVKGQGVIFFDELNLAPPLVQANAYQIIQDRKLNDYIVPDGFMCVGAGNMSDDRAHT